MYVYFKCIYGRSIFIELNEINSYEYFTFNYVVIIGKGKKIIYFKLIQVNHQNCNYCNNNKYNVYKKISFKL